MPKCETVKIKSEKGYVVINKADYDEKIHQLFDTPKIKEDKKPLKKGKK